MKQCLIAVAMLTIATVLIGAGLTLYYTGANQGWLVLLPIGGMPLGYGLLLTYESCE